MVVASSTPNRNLRVGGYLYNQKRVGKKWTLYSCKEARRSDCSASIRLHNNGYVEKQGKHCPACKQGQPLSDITTIMGGENINIMGENSNIMGKNSNVMGENSNDAGQDENSDVNNKTIEDALDVTVSMKRKAERMALYDM